MVTKGTLPCSQHPTKFVTWCFFLRWALVIRPTSPNWRTAPYRLSATAHSAYFRIASIRNLRTSHTLVWGLEIKKFNLLCYLMSTRIMWAILLCRSVVTSELHWIIVGSSFRLIQDDPWLYFSALPSLSVGACFVIAPQNAILIIVAVCVLNRDFSECH
jgi:hypothetical protein